MRRRTGERSLRAFWVRLVAESGRPADEQVSYEAVRNYHYDREPTVKYLKTVARVFGVPLEWLATGKGPQAVAAPAFPHVDKMPGILARAGLTEATRALFNEVWRLYLLAAPEGYPLRAYPELGAGLDLLSLLELPLEMWGLRHRDTMNERELNTYYAAMLHALTLAIPEPASGDRPDDWGVLYATGFTLDYAEDRVDKLRAGAAEYERLVQEHDMTLQALDNAIEEIKQTEPRMTEAEAKAYLDGKLAEVRRGQSEHTNTDGGK